MNQFMNYLSNSPQMPMGYGYQQYQPMHHGVVTKIVDDFSQITANDVPMDSNGAFFVKKDGSEIQHRVWTAQGTIANRPFKAVSSVSMDNAQPNSENVSAQAINELLALFDSKFTELNSRFDKIEKVIKPTTRRKEAEND